MQMGEVTCPQPPSGDSGKMGFRPQGPWSPRAFLSTTWPGLTWTTSPHLLHSGRGDSHENLAGTDGAASDPEEGPPRADVHTALEAAKNLSVCGCPGA